MGQRPMDKTTNVYQALKGREQIPTFFRFAVALSGLI